MKESVMFTINISESLEITNQNEEQTIYEYYLLENCALTNNATWVSFEEGISELNIIEIFKRDSNIVYSKITKLPFDKQVDLWSRGKWNNRSQLVLFKNMPKLYLGLGLTNIPMTLSASKMDRIVNDRGKQKGEYHGLGIEIVKKLPQAIANPLNILESRTVKDSIVVVTELSDSKNRVVIVSIAIDGCGHIEVTDVNNKNEIKRLQSNVVTSAYGRNNYETWMQNNKGRMIYDKDGGFIKKRIDGKWLQLPSGINSSTNENITIL